MKKIIFIIIAYQPDLRVLRKLIISIRPYKCLVINNGGLDTLGMKDVNVLSDGNNLGFGPGANLGIMHMKNSGCSWFVVVNQDIRVTKKAVAEFVLRLEKTPAGIAGPVIGSIDQKRWTTILGSKKENEVYISGSWYAIHRKVIEQIGMFYEPYFLYYEDVDLCMRVKQKGLALTKIPLSGFCHDETSSLGKGSIVHQYFLARNHLLFVERCAPLSVKLYELVRLPKTVWEHKLKQEYGALFGLRNYLLRWFGPLNKDTL